MSSYFVMYIAPMLAMTANFTGWFTQVIDLIVWAVTILGAFLVAWGGVKLGLAIREQQGGNAMSEAIMTLAGGAVIIVAAQLFKQLSSNTPPSI